MLFAILLLVLCVGSKSGFILEDSDNLNRTHSTLFLQEARTVGGTFGSRGLCVIGCTPYVDFSAQAGGVRKYRRLVREMASNCDVLVHIGDTKAGNMPCNRTVMTWSVHILKQAARQRGKLALYAPGDNELNDCHRFASRDGNPIPSDFYKAIDARTYLVDNLRLRHRRDLTTRFKVDNHYMPNANVPGTSDAYSCDFDKYVELENYAVATLEVIGSHYYLDDERKNRPPRNYPNQDKVDPLAGRLPLFLNANECTLDWIDKSAAKAAAGKKRALFFMFHALFYTGNGETELGNNGIGEYYNTQNLERITKSSTGKEISKPYQPLFDRLTATALKYPKLMIYVVHADGHRFSSHRMNPNVDNRGKGRIDSHHNLMLHMVEGGSRALTMYSKFTVDDEAFQPVTLKQEWSRSAYNELPKGHAWDPY